MTRQNRITSFHASACVVAALAANPALAIYKCETPGAPPTYQDAPCPAAASASVIETDKERAVRLKREAADRVAQEEAKRKAAAQQRADAETAARSARVQEAYDAAQRASPQEIAEAGCRRGIKAKMPYLEPVGEFSSASPGWSDGYLTIRVAVRLSDSFRAAAVGVVECSVRKVDGEASVTKIPM